MDNVIHLYEITPQEEIFCQYYVTSVDAAYAAYHANYNNKKNDIEFKDMNIKDIATLSTFGNKVLKKPNIKKRISEITRIEVEKNNTCTLDEILEYLTICIRKSKWNLKDQNLMKNALKAAELFIKRFPDFEESKTEKDSMKFSRGV